MGFDRKSSLKPKYTDSVNSFKIDFGYISFAKIGRREGLNKVCCPKLIIVDDSDKTLENCQ